MSRAIPLFGAHVCIGDGWCDAFTCGRNPANVRTRKERREARRYAAKQARRRHRREARRA